MTISVNVDRHQSTQDGDDSILSINSQNASHPKIQTGAILPSIITPISSPGRLYQTTSSLRGSQSPGSSIADYSRRRKFDERLQSRVASSSSFQSKLNNITGIRPRELTQSSLSPFLKETPDAMKWLKLNQLNTKLYSRDLHITYGDPLCIVPGETFLCIGSSRGYILIFDYQQNLLFVLGSNTKAVEVGPISTLALSLDSTYICAGYDSGHIFIWDISKQNGPIISIPPIEKSSNSSSTSDSAGHLKGSKICQLSFLGKRHTAIVSSDISGLMIAHEGGRRLLNYYINSKVMLGAHRLTEDIEYGSTILSWSCLGLGTNKQLTDDIGVMAILTPSVLIVISTLPTLQTHFKVGKPKVIKESLCISGFVSWYPAIVNKEEGRSTYPLLAYCWSNVLTIFEVISESIKDKDGNESVMLRFENKKRWVCEEGIVALQWINSKIVGILTSSQRLVILNKETMKVACNIDVVTKYIKSTAAFPHDSGLMESSYSNSFKVYKNRLFLLGRYECFVGTLTNWADSIFGTLANGYYIEALNMAKVFYEGSCDLAVIGLPTDNNLRHMLLHKHITELLNSSLNFLFADNNLLDTDDNGRWDFLSNFLSTCFDLLVLLKPELEVYENIYEKYESNGFLDLYFDVLEDYIMKGLVVSLPPVVLKAIVEFYVNIGKGEVLEELLCLLDIHQLDIDLTISLCKSNHLQDTFVYIWNTLMGDFISPMFDAIEIIKNLVFKTDDYSESEISDMQKDSYYIYPYISYILTGRQFPTDRPILDTEETMAKQNIYYVLFNGTSIAWPKKSKKIHIMDDFVEEPAFPYLYLLLKYDSTQMFACLNEAFEDSLLNDDEIVHNNSQEGIYELKVSRQYIIEVLLGILEGNSDFSNYDRTLLAIFVARNYPKYSQLIRLSDSVLRSVVEDLCSYGSEDLKDDCELSLQSLLSIYKPADFDSLISMFQDAGFHHALLSIYKTENKTIKLLELWLQTVDEQSKTSLALDQSPSIDDSVEYNPFVDYNDEPVVSAGPLGIFEMFDSVPAMIARCFETSAANPSEKMDVEKFIRKNFEKIIRTYPSEIASVFAKYCPSLHQEILKLGDSYHKYLYMKEIVRLERSNQFNFVLDNDIKIEYIRQIISNDIGNLTNYVTTLDSSAVPLDKVIEILKSVNATDTILELYKRDERYEEAVVQILESMNKCGSDLIADLLQGSTSVDVGYLEDQLWHFLFVGFRICELSHNRIDGKKFTHLKSISELTNTELLLLSLVEVPVKLLIDTNKEISKFPNDAPSARSITMLEFCKRLIQDSFSGLVSLCARSNFGLINKIQKGDGLQNTTEASSSSSNAFLNIFSQFLNRSSAKITTLGDVREVLKEIFLAYTIDEKIQNTILKLLNEDTFLEMLQYENKKNAGYSLRNLDCEVCGKRVWGSGITKGIYEVWEDYKLLKAGLLTEEDMNNKEVDDILKRLEIVTFGCRHAYHTKCLKGMGVNDTNDYKCILCTNNK